MPQKLVVKNVVEFVTFLLELNPLSLGENIYWGENEVNDSSQEAFCHDLSALVEP